MDNATHAEAVAALKSVTSSCQLVVSREVLVVLPDDIAEEGEGEGEEPVPTEPQGEGAEGEQQPEQVAKKLVQDALRKSLEE